MIAVADIGDFYEILRIFWRGVLREERELLSPEGFCKAEQGASRSTLPKVPARGCG